MKKGRGMIRAVAVESMVVCVRVFSSSIHIKVQFCFAAFLPLTLAGLGPKCLIFCPSFSSSLLSNSSLLCPIHSRLGTQHNKQ